MKKYSKRLSKSKKKPIQTDIQDSCLYSAQNLDLKSILKRKSSKKNIIKPLTQPQPKKILRLKLNNLKRTLRVPLYDEKSLNLPLRFTKKLVALKVDNDVDTDSEVVQHEINRYCKWLRQAIKAYKQEPRNTKYKMK